MKKTVFVGGGNMASAIISGLLKQGRPAASLHVVEPQAEQRERLRTQFGVSSQADASLTAGDFELAVWAVKPQRFAQAADECAAALGGSTLHLSVMAGIRVAAIAGALRTERVVRAMPNTPALIGQGIAGMFAADAVSTSERGLAELALQATGRTLWVDAEADLDAVTALSGSGPAYVFYFVEAMMEAALQMGLSAEVGRELALATFAGATALAQGSDEAPSTLRERVTSKGGTTHAALTLLEQRGVKDTFVQALMAAQERAKALGDEFGGSAARP